MKNSRLNIHTSCKSSEWETPPDLFRKYNKRFGFQIDVAAPQDNALLPKYWTMDDDALTKDWAPMVCGMNPPYGRAIAQFIARLGRKVNGVQRGCALFHRGQIRRGGMTTR